MIEHVFTSWCYQYRNVPFFSLTQAVLVSFSCLACFSASAYSLNHGGAQTSIADAWRFKIFQIPENAPEFKFRSPNASTKRDDVAALTHTTSAWMQRDRDFEEQGLFCKGLWLGVQVLQLPEDLLYWQQLVVRLRPQVVVETGSFRGGLAFFIASVMSQIGLDSSRVVTLDTFSMQSNFHNLDNNPLCPVCLECVKAYETDLWRKHVIFFEGNSIHLADQVTEIVASVRTGSSENLGPTIVTLDSLHDYAGTLMELHLYAGLVDVGSYLVIQDARLDATYDRAGPMAAGARLLDDGTSQWVWDRDVEVFGHTQHLWLRRISLGPPVSLQFGALDQDLIQDTPFKLFITDARCALDSTDLDVLRAEGPDVTIWTCQAACYRLGPSKCLYVSFSTQESFANSGAIAVSTCTFLPHCHFADYAPGSMVYVRKLD